MFTFIPILLQYIEIPSVYFLHEPFGRSFTRHFDRPYLITNTRREWLNRYDPLINLYHRRLDTLQKNSVRNTGRLLANSNFTRELTQKAFGIETPVCSYGVDLSSFDIENGMQKENIVISVGELSPRKGFDFVVKSLGQIPNEYRPPLIVACNSVIPQERAYVEGLAAQYGVDLQVLTHLGTGELRQLYNRARLCAYAPVLEPFGLVPLEAMACGTPVVGVREGGVQESIVHQRTGLLVERDPVEFGAAVEYLLENQDIAEEYGRNGREHVLNNWTWERSVDELGRHLLDCSNPT
jgi:glycosyltransferase involved in cell wall biosynthesis